MAFKRIESTAVLMSHAHLRDLEDFLVEKYQHPLDTIDARVDAIFLIATRLAWYEAETFLPDTDPEDRVVDAPLIREYRKMLALAREDDWNPIKQYCHEEARDCLSSLEDEKEALF